MRRNYNDNDIVVEEYKIFMTKILGFPPDAKYYVYGLFEQDGTPFYIGKGSGPRAYDHIWSESRTSKKIVDHINQLNGEAPIAHLIEGGLSESEAYDLEGKLIAKYGRYFEGGTLLNVLPGGSGPDSHLSSVVGGKIGGRKTRDSGLGIFSPSHNRSAQSKLTHARGLVPTPSADQLSAMGTATKNKKAGIFDVTLQHKRSEWARLGAIASFEAHGLTGAVSKKFREENKEASHAWCSAGGKIGGATVGKMLWWNDGAHNRKSFIVPGPMWDRGMIKSKKGYRCSLQRQHNERN